MPDSARKGQTFARIVGGENSKRAAICTDPGTRIDKETR